MTDISLPTTQNVVPLDPAAITPSAPPMPLPAALVNGQVTEDGDGEDYTIKCICSFTDDDGSTVMCERCDTWQHVACYYQDGNAPGDDDAHFCVDCQPRKLDSRTADEIQRRLRGSTPEETQRKPKKPGPKPRRKTKNEHLTQTNGHTNGHGSPRNGTDSHSKKPKARHQSSNSTTNIPLKLPGQPSRRSASTSHIQPNSLKSPNSPSITCDPNEAFSPEFMHLYDNDSGSSTANVNEFDDIGLTMTLSDWVRDGDILARATNGKTKADIFQRSHKPIHSEPFMLQIHTKVDKNISAHGKHPKWKFITIEEDVGQAALVGELHGKIGSMQQYTQEPTNRWEYLRHPVPFVFFHPQLPIIVDTREEGSVFRHLRRSCSPNLTMKTVLEEEFDYHFVFAATREIEKGEELTIPWTLDEHTRRFFMNPRECDVDEEYVVNYCRNVLAEFGGCACNEANCVIATWAGWNEPTRPKAPKGKRKAARGLGSRSGSEALKQHDEDLDDGTAGSTSSHSKPQSRDITPSSIIDSKNILGEPISEREKRKIAALEKSEQDRHPVVKKQKRKSGDNRPGSHNPPPTPGVGKRAGHHDANFKDSASPVPDTGYRTGSRVTPSPLHGTSMTSPPPPKPVYRENSCQTDVQAASPPRVLPSPTHTLPKRPKNPLHRHVFRRSVLVADPNSASDSVSSPTTEAKTEPLVASDGQKPETSISGSKDSKDEHAVGEASSQVGAALGPLIPPEIPIKAEPRDFTVKDSDTSSGTLARSPTSNIADAVNRVSLDAKVSQAVPATDNPDMDEAMPPPASIKKSLSTAGSPATSEASASLSVQAPSKAFAHTKQPPEERSPEADKKKKISFKDFMARRSSNNNNNATKQDPDGIRETSHDVAGTLAPVKEPISETNLEDGSVLDTPTHEPGDPMVQ